MSIIRYLHRSICIASLSKGLNGEKSGVEGRTSAIKRSYLSWKPANQTLNHTSHLVVFPDRGHGAHYKDLTTYPLAPLATLAPHAPHALMPSRLSPGKFGNRYKSGSRRWRKVIRVAVSKQWSGRNNPTMFCIRTQILTQLCSNLYLDFILQGYDFLKSITLGKCVVSDPSFTAVYIWNNLKHQEYFFSKVNLYSEKNWGVPRGP